MMESLLTENYEIEDKKFTRQKGSFWIEIPTSSQTKIETHRKVIKKRRPRRHIQDTDNDNQSRIRISSDFHERKSPITYLNSTIIKPDDLLVMPFDVSEIAVENLYLEGAYNLTRKQPNFISLESKGSKSHHIGHFVIFQNFMCLLLIVLYYDIALNLAAETDKYI